MAAPGSSGGRSRAPSSPKHYEGYDMGYIIVMWEADNRWGANGVLVESVLRMLGSSKFEHVGKKREIVVDL